MKKHIGILFTIFLIFIVSCASDNNIVSKINSDKKKSSIGEEEYVKALGDDWFEAVGTASYSNITPEEAKRKAILNACINAIQYCGIEVNQRNLDVQSESNHKIIQNDFLSLTNLTTNGVILEKVIVDEKVVNDGDHIQIVIKLKVKIGRQQGQKDPYFSVKASLNRDVFKVDDTLQIAITSTQDCYLTILDISNDVVYVLFPNKYFEENYLTKGQRFEFPNKNHMKMGMTIPAILPRDKDKDMGVIKILATKKETSFEGLSRESEYGTYELVLHDLLNFLIKIPLNEIEEVDLPYMITR